MKSFLTLIGSTILLLSVQSVSAQVLFSTNFEAVQDWTMPRPPINATGYAWEGSSGTPGYPPPKRIDGSQLYDLYRVGATLFEPPYVTTAYEIKNAYGRLGGRGLRYNVEVSGTNGIWTGGSPMEVWLGTAGYQDVYVRFFLCYPAVWKWTNEDNPDSNRGAYQKIMKIVRYNGTLGDGGNAHLYVAPANGGRNHPVWIPDWYQYISVKPSYTKYINSERYSPDYTANDPVQDFYSVKPNLYPNGSDFLWPTDSQWHCYEFRAKMNSAPGVADGISEIWLDGKRVFSKTNITWVKTGGSVTQGWNLVTILDNATIPAFPLASHVTYPLYLDDVVISTSYIGPDYVIGGIPSQVKNARKTFVSP